LTFSRPQKLIHLLRGIRQPVSSGDLLMVLLRITLTFSSLHAVSAFPFPISASCQSPCWLDLLSCSPLVWGALCPPFLIHCLLYFSFSSLFLYFAFYVSLFHLFIFQFFFPFFFPVISYIYMFFLFLHLVVASLSLSILRESSLVSLHSPLPPPSCLSHCINPLSWQHSY